MLFEDILTTLKKARDQAVLEHDEFIQRLDILILNVEAMDVSTLRQIEDKIPTTIDKIPTKIVNGKVKFDEIESVLKKAKKTLHLDEICQKVGTERGSIITKGTISMLISHHFRKFKHKSQIKQVKKFYYQIKQ
jgi:hypothetical protein